jgi:hypothetical protein
MPGAVSGLGKRCWWWLSAALSTLMAAVQALTVVTWQVTVAVRGVEQGVEGRVEARR